MTRRLSFVLTALLLTIILSGCTALGLGKENVTLRVAALRGPTGVGMVKMLEDKPSLGNHVTVEYQVAETPDVVTARVLSKEIDIAALPTNLAANLYNKGAGYKLLAINTWGNLYLVSNEVEIVSWEDFKGKTINSIGLGATPDLVFRSLLIANGLDPDKDVSMDYSMAQVELAGALSAGRVALAVLPEPLVTTTLTKNASLKIVMSLEDEWKKIHGDNIAIAQGCLVVREEFAKKHPEVVASFLKQYQESMTWVNSNLEQAGTLIEKHSLGMPAAVAVKAIPRSNIRYMAALDARSQVEAYFNVLLDLAPQAVGGKLPDEGFYYKR